MAATQPRPTLAPTEAGSLWYGIKRETLLSERCAFHQAALASVFLQFLERNQVLVVVREFCSFPCLLQDALSARIYQLPTSNQQLEQNH